MKMWKRRTSLRQAKAKLVRLAAEQARAVYNQAVASSSRRSRPLLDGDAVAHVVLPRAVDLQVALGDAFLADRQHLHHPSAVGVARHDADLQAVQVELLEGEPGEHDDGLGDVALAGPGPVDPVADRAGLQSRRGRRCSG